MKKVSNVLFKIKTNKEKIKKTQFFDGNCKTSVLNCSYLQVNAISQFVLVSEVRSSRASVQKVLWRIFTSDIGEPEFAFRIYSQSGRVDGLQPILALQHPIHTGLGPTIGCVAFNTKGSTFLHAQRSGGLVFEIVQFGFAYKYRVGGGSSPLVGSKALVLTCNDRK